MSAAYMCMREMSSTRIWENPPVPTLPKKSDSPVANSHQLSVAPQNIENQDDNSVGRKIWWKILGKAEG